MPSCPEPFRWKVLLEGRVTVPDEIRQRALEHLESCERCQWVVDELTGDKSWTDAAKKLREGQPERGQAFRRAVDKLKGEAGQPGETSVQPALDFLSPADKPGLLGRLGPYEVQELIGRGGMGIVLKALDPSLNRVVAIKVLAPELAVGGTARRRFVREAQAAAAVTHEHVITIHAVDEANRPPYLVMQYVAGMSLQECLDEGGPLELKEILRIGVQTAAGLAAAHAQGLIHRDIKPANILLENGVQRVKITDFGLARAVDDASLTQSGVIAGTPHYMSPEQARGEELDHRSDLFSLGSVLYAMCAGRPPFRASSTLAVLRRVSDDKPTPVREVNPDVPDWLAQVIEKLHAKDPADRHQSAAEVAEVLGQHLARLQQASWTPPPIPQPPPIPAPPSPASDSTFSSPGAGAKATGPITSLTICPSCKSPLHVPEDKVGKVVDCPQCGKPFRVEDGSKEIQVVRGVRPAGPPWPPRKRKFAKVLLLLGGVAFLLLLCCGLPVLIFSFLFVARNEASVSSAVVEEFGVPAQGRPGEQSRWAEAMSWFPPETTLCGGYDFTSNEPLTPHSPLVQALREKLVPPEKQKEFTAQRFGDLRLDRLAFAFCEDAANGKDARLVIRLSGFFNRDVLAQALSELLPAGGQVAEENGPRGESILTISHPELPYAFALINAEDILVACSVEPDPKRSTPAAALLRQVLRIRHSTLGPPAAIERGTWPWERNLLRGRLGPSIRSIPSNTSGALVGTVPAALRDLQRTELKLPFVTDQVDLQIRRDHGNYLVELDLSFAKPGDAKAFVEQVEKWRRLGLDFLDRPPPGPRPQADGVTFLRRGLQGVRLPGTGVPYLLGTERLLVGGGAELSGGASQKELWRGTPWSPDRGPLRVTALLAPEAVQALVELIKQMRPWYGAAAAPAGDRK